jgi:hypothetical protein
MSPSATYKANASILDIRREEIGSSVLSEMKGMFPSIHEQILFMNPLGRFMNGLGFREFSGYS